MADPTKYTPGYDFSSFQASTPNNPLPGDRLDIELADIAEAVDQTIDALKDIRRADGVLKNGIVTLESLGVGVLDEVSGEAVSAAQEARDAAIVAQTSAEASADAAIVAQTSAEASAAAAALNANNLILHVQDAIASDTGGDFIAGPHVTRRLQTIVKNTIDGASLSSNVITLPAGTYFVIAEAQGYQVSQHAIRLRKTNGTAINLAHGLVQYAVSPATVGNTSRLTGEFTIAETSTIELQHKCGATRLTAGWGVGLPSPEVNIYAEVFVKRIA